MFFQTVLDVTCIATKITAVKLQDKKYEQQGVLVMQT